MAANPGQPLFRSFLQGGFEASSHRRRDGRQLDIVAATRHDLAAEQDYALLRQAGLLTARDGLRWHLIETAPGRYDWSSFLPMLRAAQRAGIQVIWDLCHYGLPHDIDIWSPEFVDRFAAFAAAAARVVREEGGEAPVWCPMNEVSFWSWAGGDKGDMHPFGETRGYALKQQLVRAAIAAVDAVRAVDRRARFMQAEPLIYITAHPDRPHDRERAELYRRAQYQTWDMMAGTVDPALGGSPEHLDIIGVNFYFNNEWVHEVEAMGMGHRLFRPLHEMLAEVYARYSRPLMISETGAEGVNGPGWLHYVGAEVRTAMRCGIPLEGLCIYPVMDYPGWVDDRHCPAGLIRLDDGYGTRTVDAAMAMALEEQAMLLRPLLGTASRMDLAAE